MWEGRTRRIVPPPIAQIAALAAAARASGRETVNLGQAVLAVPPPARALERVRAYLDAPGAHGYSPDPGRSELLAALAEFFRTRKGVAAANPDRFIVTCGANQAFVNAILAITEPGDEVVHFGPNYFDHEFAIQLAGCAPVEVPLALGDGGWAIDLERFESALTPRTRAVALVSPANPAGALFERASVRQLAEVCAGRGIWLISDETYDLLTFAPDEHRSPAAFGSSAERVIVVGSFSKTFALAGWRVGYLYGSEELVAEALKVQDALVVCAPVPSQEAALGALESVDTFVPAALAELTRRRDALLAGLAAIPALEPARPRGATFVLARLRDPRYAADSFAFSRDLLEATGLVTVPGCAFGRYGEGFVRLSFGNQPPAVLSVAAERLSEFCD